MSRLYLAVVCTHVSCRKSILGDSSVTLVSHPLLHLITLADGKAKSTFESQGGGSDWEKRCQMDILTCRGGLKTLEVSTMKIYKACALCTDSHCDWNPVALSGNNSGTRQRQVDLQLWPKDEVSYQGTKVWQDFCLLGWVWPSLCWWCGLTLACLTGGLLLIYLTWNPPSAT